MLAFARSREPNETHPIYLHEASGVKIRKRVVRGEPEYNIYLPDDGPPVGGARTLGEAKAKALPFVQRIMDVGEDV